MVLHSAVGRKRVRSMNLGNGLLGFRLLLLMLSSKIMAGLRRATEAWQKWGWVGVVY